MRTEDDVQNDIDMIEDELIEARWQVETYEEQVSAFERTLAKLERELDTIRVFAIDANTTK